MERTQEVQSFLNNTYGHSHIEKEEKTGSFKQKNNNFTKKKKPFRVESESTLVKHVILMFKIESPNIFILCLLFRKQFWMFVKYWMLFYRPTNHIYIDVYSLDLSVSKQLVCNFQHTWDTAASTDLWTPCSLAPLPEMWQGIQYKEPIFSVK